MFAEVLISGARKCQSWYGRPYRVGSEPSVLWLSSRGHHYSGPFTRPCKAGMRLIKDEEEGPLTLPWHVLSPEADTTVCTYQ